MLQMCFSVKKADDPIVVIGGGLTGCETALWLAQQGKKVTIVEVLDELMTAGIPVPHMNRMMLLDLLKFHGVTLITNSRPLEITDGGIILLNALNNQSAIKSGTIVIATGLKPENSLFQSLKKYVPCSYVIGDAQQPRNIMAAIWDAYEIANSV